MRPSEPELDPVSPAFARPGRARLLRWAAALVLVSGYATLVAGGVTLAPALLVVGYFVLVPLALLAR
jgi:hypothetical protein